MDGAASGFLLLATGVTALARAEGVAIQPAREINEQRQRLQIERARPAACLEAGNPAKLSAERSVIA